MTCTSRFCLQHRLHHELSNRHEHGDGQPLSQCRRSDARLREQSVFATAGIRLSRSILTSRRHDADDGRASDAIRCPADGHSSCGCQSSRWIRKNIRTQRSLLNRHAFIAHFFIRNTKSVLFSPDYVLWVTEIVRAFDAQEHRLSCYRRGSIFDADSAIHHPQGEDENFAWLTSNWK